MEERVATGRHVERLEPPDWDAVDPDAALTLVVGWRSGTKMRLGRLTLSEEVANDLGAVVAQATADLADRQPEAWTPDADLPDESYLTMAADTVGTHPILAKDIEQHGTLLAALREGASLAPLPASRLPAAELAFYAMVVGDDPDGRAVFVRRANPRRGLRRGKRFTTYADALVRVEAPIFAFDELIDLVYVEDKLIVLSQTAFMALFRDNAALAAQVPRWVADIAKHLPLVDDGDKILADLAQRNSRIRTRVEAIARRGHLATVTSRQIRKAMTEVGLDPDIYVRSGKLVIEEATANTLLQFLNEDLFVGGLSATGFRADRKSAR
jgi:hypothetical protein